MSEVKRHWRSGKFLIAIAIGALFLSLSLGCAPASSDTSAGVGRVSPPFAMTLADGSQVTSADIVADAQPVHLFWFATW